MRILVVTPFYWPALQFGGPITSVHLMNRAIVRRRSCEIDVYTTNCGVEKSVEADRARMLDGITVTYFHYLKALEWLGSYGWQYSPALCAALRRNIQSYDLVYVVGIWNFPSVIAPYMARRYGMAYIISPRAALGPYNLARKAWKKKLFLACFVRRSLAHADALHFFSANEALESTVNLSLTTPTINIPNGVEIDSLDRAASRAAFAELFPSLAGKVAILFLGRLHPIKGLDVLARAVASLTQVRHDFHVLIAGGDEGGFQNEIRRLVSALGVQHRFTFLVQVSGDYKKVLLTGSDVFVLPSYSEGFSMAILEAMASGVPVVISKNCHFDQVGTAKAGFVVDTSPSEIARVLRTLIEDSTLRLSMGTAGRTHVEQNYSIDLSAAMMVQAYQDIARRH